MSYTGLNSAYSFFVRKTIAEKLIKISELLPDGMYLALIEGYRSMQHQQLLWDTKFSKFKTENPDWSDEYIEQQVCLLVAKPAPLANHHCGGAVDVTLFFTDGTPVDMGTPYITAEDMTYWHKKFPMLSEEITDEQKANRKILRDAMETEDFVWYPGEWWHYCWGDRMWAVYSNQQECCYGPVYF
jgi:D-alanyl-D-alanine dipeptidase